MAIGLISETGASGGLHAFGPVVANDPDADFRNYRIDRTSLIDLIGPRFTVWAVPRIVRDA
jgi:hypothetical protein